MDLSKMDSDDSDDMFSDGELVPCTQFDRTPDQQLCSDTANIPKTPLSLHPFISNEPVTWTADLETPDIGKKDPPKATEEDIIPASPSTHRVKKRLSRRILADDKSPNYLASRIRRARELRIYSSDKMCLDTVDNEFNESLELWKCGEKNVPEFKVQKQARRPPNTRLLGLVPFSSIYSDEEYDFPGFSSDSHSCSQLYKLRFDDFLQHMSHNFKGFTSSEIEKSQSESNRFNVFLNVYLNDNDKDDDDHSKDDGTAVELPELPPVVVHVNSGFKTATGKEITLNIDRILQSKTVLLQNEDKISKQGIDRLLPSVIIKPETKLQNTPSIPAFEGFKTGRGKDIKIPEKALQQATKIYFDDAKSAPPSLGFQTAGGKNLTISNTAMTKAQSTFAQDLDNFTLKDLTTRKRTKDDEDETPVGRKKPCVGLELQKRKLFDDIEEEEVDLSKADMVATDRRILNQSLKPMTVENNVVSDEVRESIAALLKDEESFDDDEPLNDKHSLQRTTRSLYEPSNILKNVQPRPKRPRSFPETALVIQDSIDGACFDSPFSQELIALRAAENRSAAILEQERRIEDKKRIREKPIKGSSLRVKESNTRISLREFFGGCPPISKSLNELERDGLHSAITSINSSNASSFMFNCADCYEETFLINHMNGIPLDDEAILIPNDNNHAGIAEFKRSFLAMPGVDPSLLPTGWIENHYKWIIWKLASMDRIKSAKTILPKFLTPDQVMKQLKYRYDREIDRSQRPSLRRIIEKDDSPSRRLVLCVSRIFKATNETRGAYQGNQRTIELTDGWYSIPAVIDYAMVEQINSGKVKEGTKLFISGAELKNLEEGRYPLDIPANVSLKIHTNSTCRARWDTKLGYQRECGAINSRLQLISPHGGVIGKLTVAIARVYPIVYREKMKDGQFIDRNARTEDAVAYTSNLKNGVRNVTPIAKIKVADNDVTALITLWHGVEESQSILKENTCVTITNLFASRKQGNELQITAGRFTIFSKAPPETKITCPKRVFTSLEHVSMPGFNPYYSEFDTVGLVVSRGPAPHGMKNFETVNLAFSSFYLSILFWQGTSSYGYSEITKIGSFLACSNLEWRKRVYKSIPTAFCTERTILTCNPRQDYLRQALDNFRTTITDIPSYVETCAAAIQAEIEKKTGNTTMVRTPITPMSTKSRINQLECYGNPPNLTPLHLIKTPKATLDYRSPVNR